MQLDLIWIGKTQDSEIKGLIDAYSKKVSKYCKFEILELKGTKQWQDVDDLKKKEADQLSPFLESYDQVYLFDEKGKQMSSTAFAEQIEGFAINGLKKVAFVIGGAYGFSDDLKDQYRLISFSKMTFNHQVFRIMVLEQLHRAQTIIHNVPYHH